MAIQPIPVQDVPNVHQTQNFQPQQTETFQPVGGGTTQAVQASQPFVKEIERQVLQADEKTKAKAFEKWLGEREKGIDALMIDIERQAQQNPKLQPVVEPLKRKAQLYKQALQGIKDPEKARETLFQFADDVTKASIDAIGVKTPEELGQEAKAKMEGGLKSEDRLRLEQKIRNEGKTTKPTDQDKKQEIAQKLAPARKENATKKLTSLLEKAGFTKKITKGFQPGTLEFEGFKGEFFPKIEDQDKKQKLISQAMKKAEGFVEQINKQNEILGEPLITLDDFISFGTAAKSANTPGTGTETSTTQTGANKSLIEKAKKMLSEVRDPEKRKQIQEKIRLLEQQVQGNR